MLLSQAVEHEELLIDSVNTDYRHKRHLENLSILSGETITCLYNRSGDVVVKVKDGRIAINREFARLIEVTSLNPQYYTESVKNGIVKRKLTKAAKEMFKEEDKKYRQEEKMRKKELKRKGKKR